LIFIVLATASFAQPTYTLKDLFKTDTITWYGIDYTRAVFKGPFPEDKMTIFYHGWNQLMIDEQDKYDIGKALHKKVVINDITDVEQRNNISQAIIHKATLGNDSLVVTRPELRDIITAYQSKQNHGFGVVFIAVQYNKKTDMGTHFIVIFDIASRKILLTQRYECSTLEFGIGRRNYWAGSIYNTFKVMPYYYKKWKKQYGA